MAPAKKTEKALEFPVKDALYDSAFHQLMANLAIGDSQSSAPGTLTYVRLGINVATIYTPLVNLLGTPTTANCWASVYPAEKASGTHTGPLTTQKKTIKKNALKLIRAERIILKELEKVSPGTLTALDKKVWYIGESNAITPSMDAVRTQHPMPALTIHETLDTVNPESPKSKGMPEGMQFIWIKRFIGAVAPTDPDLYGHVIFSGRFRNLSDFSATYRRQPVWYIAAYISTTGVVGKFCDPVNGTVN